MFCKNCGKQIPPESIYCMHCGAPVFSGGREAQEQTAQEQVKTPKSVPLRVRPVRTQEPPLRRFEEEPEELVRIHEPERHDASVCRVCGSRLPEGSKDDICESCMIIQQAFSVPDPQPEPEPVYSEPVLPPRRKNFQLDLDLDSEFGPASYENAESAPLVKADPIAARRRHPRWLIPALAAALVLLVAGIIMVFRFVQPEDKPAHSAGAGQTSSAPSAKDLEAADYAQEMVIEAARDPSSVHFEQSTLDVEAVSGKYTVTQEFERSGTDGNPVTATYLAVLTLEPANGKSYTPLLLKVDDKLLYDYQ